MVLRMLLNLKMNFMFRGKQKWIEFYTDKKSDCFMCGSDGIRHVDGRYNLASIKSTIYTSPNLKFIIANGAKYFRVLVGYSLSTAVTTTGFISLAFITNN